MSWAGTSCRRTQSAAVETASRSRGWNSRQVLQRATTAVVDRHPHSSSMIAVVRVDCSRTICWKSSCMIGRQRTVPRTALKFTVDCMTSHLRRILEEDTQYRIYLTALHSPYLRQSRKQHKARRVSSATGRVLLVSQQLQQRVTRRQACD